MSRYLELCVLSSSARLPQCAVTVHKACADHQWNGYQGNAHIHNHPSMCRQHTKRFGTDTNVPVVPTQAALTTFGLPQYQP